MPAAGCEGQLRVRHLDSSRHCLSVHCWGNRKTLEYVGPGTSGNVKKLLIGTNYSLMTVHLQDNFWVMEVGGRHIRGELLCIRRLHITDGGGAVGVRRVAGGAGVGRGGRSHVLTRIPSTSPQCEEDHDCEAY